MHWMKAMIEGGIFAVLACLLPYPRLAVREGAGRAQYNCRLMCKTVAACIDAFNAGRDERLISRVTLLVEQMRLNLEHLGKLIEPCRMELMVLMLGQGGGLAPAECLAVIVKVCAPHHLACCTMLACSHHECSICLYSWLIPTVPVC
jgi:hypothetical protein